MKRLLSAAGWAVLFAASGAALFVITAVAAGAPHTLPRMLLLFFAGVGAAEALIAWSFCLCFALLPHTLPAKRVPAPLDLNDAIGALAGAGLLMSVAGILPVLFPINRGILDALHIGRLSLPAMDTPLVLEFSVLAGELTVALWLSWLIRRLGPAIYRDGAPSGLGWCAAPLRAYGVAVILAVILILSVALLFHDLPPDQEKLQSMEAAKLFSGPPWALACILGVVFLLAPIVEEILFRGFAFGGFAAKWGSGWAIILSSLVFTAVHAPEKLHYPPGFIEVAMLALAACWLRLRYSSIRPGILLHMIYNTGLLLAGPLLHS